MFHRSDRLLQKEVILTMKSNYVYLNTEIVLKHINQNKEPRPATTVNICSSCVQIYVIVYSPNLLHVLPWHTNTLV